MKVFLLYHTIAPLPWDEQQQHEYILIGVFSNKEKINQTYKADTENYTIKEIELDRLYLGGNGILTV